MEDDYFGDIAVPDNEEEEDATNDLTFGHIGDIKAGDDSSDAFWKPDHQQISNTIEAEKEALLRQRLTHPQSPQQSPSNVTQGNGEHNDDHFPAARKQAWHHVSPLQSHASRQIPQPPPLPRAQYLQNSIPHSPLQQNPEQLHFLKNRAALLSQASISSPPSSMLPHLAQMPYASQIPQTQPPLPSLSASHGLPVPSAQYRALGQQTLSPQEYERNMMAYYENHTRDLLMRHKETAEMQLKEAEAAQRVGVMFDRNKFDEHQNAVRQRILTDHYSRVNHLRYLVWQHRQQLTGMEQGAKEQPRNLPNLASEANGAQTTGSNTVFNGASPDKEIRAIQNNSSDGILARVQDALRVRDAPKELNFPRNQQNQSNRSRKDKSEKPQRLLEIERQMAEAGLGPTKQRAPRERNRPRAEPSSHQGAKKKERRLESMTEKDQELVFRVHLRQVESSVVYKDDYYSSVLKKKKKYGDAELYTEIIDRVHAMRQLAKERGGKGGAGRTRRPGKASVNDDNAAAASPSHSDQNMKALATALGTVQSWNPRAPRRVMDFGVMEHGVNENGDAPKLLRDDERVHVKQEIERGYDIIASIHDIARGESTESLEVQIKDLISTLHIGESGKVTSNLKKPTSESSVFFATLCVIGKGREYLKRVLDLLDIQERASVLQATYANLGALLFSLQKSSNSGSSQSDLQSIMLKTIQDSEVSTQDCLAMMHSFISSHTSHRDALLTTFRSALGSKLIFLCMQRISRGFFKQEVQEEDLSRANMEGFSEVFTSSLQDIFDGAESVTGVWEVVASMDGLAFGEHKMKYRAELNNLLRSGAAPPPPGSKSAQQQQGLEQ